MNTLKKLKLSIKGMTCDGCAKGIEKSISQINGISQNEVNYQKGEGNFSFDESITSRENIIQEIEKSGHHKVEKELNSKTNHYDLIIIGGGSAAFSAAIKAESLGLSTLMVNAGLDFGGTCVNVGCVPSKNLIRAAETAYQASHSNFKGIHPKGVGIDFTQIIKDKKQLVATLQQKNI